MVPDENDQLNSVTLEETESRAGDFDTDSKAPVPRREVLTILRRVAESIEAARKEGVAHRDIKPSNIFLFDKEAKTVLSDFGVLGSLEYRSPEQFQLPEEIDSRTDVYSLGVLLFELLTGTLPFRGDPQEVETNKQITEKPPSVLEIDKTIPPEYDAVIQRALAKNPEDRFPNVKSMINTLELFVDSSDLRLVIEDVVSLNHRHTPDYLANIILPYLKGFIQIQGIIDEIRGFTSSPAEILAIRKGSVAVDITGGIRDTVELVLDNIVPWRRENHKKLKQAEAEQKEAEAQKAQATVEIETDKAKAEAELLRAQAEQQKLENQKSQLEIMKLTIDMLNQVAPNLTEERRLLYAMKL